MKNRLDPRPIEKETSFTPCKREPFVEDPDCYNLWESLVKKLFVQFQFFYEYLGPGSAGRQYLEQSKRQGYKNLDGSEIFLPLDADPFGEKKDVHLQLYFADGTKKTAYAFADGCNGDFHLAGIENNNLFRFAPAAEFAPLVFPTGQNFYEESVNKTFLNNSKYDQRPPCPISHLLHNDIFTPRYFKKRLKIPPGLLSVDFKGDKELTEAIRTLNFSLALLYAVCLLESAYIDFFGQRRDPLARIRYMENHWRFGSGRVAKGLNSYHLFILHYLIRLSHFSGYGIAASLFRLKNGPHSYNPGHGTWHIGGDNDHTPFKLFLEKQIRLLVEYWSRSMLKEKKEKARAGLIEQINLAIKLGELFGLGYQVDTKVGKAYYFDEPVNFSPCFAVGPGFAAVNFVARCNIESPLWRVYYLYSRKMWKTGEENQALFFGRGEVWQRNKRDPRAVQYNIINEYRLKFFLDLIRYTAADAKDKKTLLEAQKNKNKILESLTPERRKALS